MGHTAKLLNLILKLEFTSMNLQRLARMCVLEEESETLQVSTAIGKGNMDGAHIFAENSICLRCVQMNYLHLSSRLDVVVARLDSLTKMQSIGKNMGSIVEFIESSLASRILQRTSTTMEQFEEQYMNLVALAEFVEGALARSSSLLSSGGEVNLLMRQVANQHGKEVSVDLSQASALAIPARETDTVDVDDPSRRLAALKIRDLDLRELPHMPHFPSGGSAAAGICRSGYAPFGGAGPGPTFPPPSFAAPFSSVGAHSERGYGGRGADSGRGRGGGSGFDIGSGGGTYFIFVLGGGRCFNSGRGGGHGGGLGGDGGFVLMGSRAGFVGAGSFGFSTGA